MASTCRCSRGKPTTAHDISLGTRHAPIVSPRAFDLDRSDRLENTVSVPAHSRGKGARSVRRHRPGAAAVAPLPQHRRATLGRQPPLSIRAKLPQRPPSSGSLPGFSRVWAAALKASRGALGERLPEAPDNRGSTAGSSSFPRASALASRPLTGLGEELGNRSNFQAKPAQSEAFPSALSWFTPHQVC